MGASAGDLRALSECGEKGEEGDTERVLRQCRLQPEICHPVAQRTAAGAVEERRALNEIAGVLPFVLLGVESDNGSEFINWHLKSWCERKQIQLTRGRPYKKDDNAHIEQKNWTHVRKLLGWDR